MSAGEDCGIHAARTAPVGAGAVDAPAADAATVDLPAHTSDDSRPSDPGDPGTGPPRPCPRCAAATSKGDRFCEVCGARAVSTRPV